VVKKGVAGLGLMGAYTRIPQVQLAAVCTNEDGALSGDLGGVSGNLGRSGASQTSITKCLPTRGHISTTFDFSLVRDNCGQFSLRFSAADTHSTAVAILEMLAQRNELMERY
jgi:hypothetical protein